MCAKMLVTLTVLVVAGVAVAASVGSVTARDAGRPDCPGQVVCPLTGDPVCADRCPLESTGQTGETRAPSCCR